MKVDFAYAEEDIYRHFVELFDEQVSHLRRIIFGKGTQAENNNGSYYFIPNSSYRVIRDFIKIKRELRKSEHWRNKYYKEGGVSFLDAGCGIGNILVLALNSCLCQKATGLEYFPETLKLGRKFLKTYYSYISENATIKKADILKYKKYGDYDIIYFYRPFSDTEKERLFEKRIRDQMKVGSILIPYGNDTIFTQRDNRFKKTGLGSYFLFYTKVKE